MFFLSPAPLEGRGGEMFLVCIALGFVICDRVCKRAHNRRLNIFPLRKWAKEIY